MAIQGGGKQINIYPELLKRQEGKGTLCICMLGKGCHRRFYWATLTLVPANPGIKADKSWSPASLVWTLQENQEPWRADGAGNRGWGYLQCSELLAESASQDGKAGPRLDAHQFTWDERESSALPKPDVPGEYTHFHFERHVPLLGI